MRLSVFGVPLLLVVSFSNHVRSSPYFYKFGNRVYPLHYSPSSGLHVTGGDLEQPNDATINTDPDAQEGDSSPILKDAESKIVSETTEAVADDGSKPITPAQGMRSVTGDAENESILGKRYDVVTDDGVKSTTPMQEIQSVLYDAGISVPPKEPLPETTTHESSTQATKPIIQRAESTQLPEIATHVSSTQETEPVVTEAVDTQLPPVQHETVPEATETAGQLKDTIDQDLGKRPSFLTRGWRRGQTFGSSIKSQMKEMKSLPKLNMKLPQQQAVENIKEGSSKLLSAVGPATVAIGELFYRPEQVPITLPAIIALAFLGSSCGFYLFLYFITVGYALGITLPLLAAMLAYNTKSGGIKVPTLTNVHSGLVIAWGLRSLTFFLWREFVNWPELHEKVVEVNRAARINAKFFCWVVFSFFYVGMITPCLVRLQSKKTWGVLGMAAIALQFLALVVESVADYQKSAFKAIPGNRNRWCNVGLWKISSHPNYLGEMLFWISTYLGGMTCFSSTIHWVASTVGLLFVLVVLRGAVSSLGAKHLRKYGNDVEFLEFRRTHSVLGPFHLSPQPKDRVSL